MLVSFTLSMPSVGSWNGKWSGSNNLYARVRSFRGKEKETQAKELIEKGFCMYDWMIDSIIKNKKIIYENEK